MTRRRESNSESPIGDSHKNESQKQDSVWRFGRRPKHDDFDDLEPFESESEDVEEDGDEEDEEVDFDNPKFKKSDMWNDYAEDLDFEE